MLIYKRAEEMADENTVVLDIGTKDGSRASSIPGTVYALDINPQPADTLMQYIQADGSRLPFDNDTFDIVVSNQVLEHIPFERKQPFIREIARTLRPGGTFLLSFPNRLFPKNAHGFPLFFSYLPKSVGRLAVRVVEPERATYYDEVIYNLSPLRARSLLAGAFGSVRYSTLDLIQRYKPTNGGWKQFDKVRPIVDAAVRLPAVASAFELTFPYVAYECQNPSKFSTP